MQREETSMTKVGLRMRVPVLIVLLISLPFALPASQAAPPSAGMIEVTVRVERAGQFVDSLKLDDFEVLEDGRPQPLQSLYLFKGQDLLRYDERTPVQVTASRHFYLLSRRPITTRVSLRPSTTSSGTSSGRATR
jgi:hypothetical protein